MPHLVFEIRKQMDFSEVTETQIVWIQTTLNRLALTFEWPNLVIHTDSSSNTLSVTVACVAAQFVSASHV